MCRLHFKRIIRKKEEEAKIAKEEAANLRIESIEKDQKITKLEKEKENIEKEITKFSNHTFFKRSVFVNPRL